MKTNLGVNAMIDVTRKVIERFPSVVDASESLWWAPETIAVRLRSFWASIIAHPDEWSGMLDVETFLRVRPQVRIRIENGRTLIVPRRHVNVSSVSQEITLTVPNDDCWRALYVLAHHRVLPMVVRVMKATSSPPPPIEGHDVTLSEEDHVWVLI